MTIHMTQADFRKLGGIPRRSKNAPKRNGMNKLESQFSRMLDMWKAGGIVEWYAFEQIKFRLAGRTWYTPDFFVVEKTKTVIYEVKGFWRDDARVKIKVAAEMYPHFTWIGCRFIRGEWHYEYF